MPRVVVVGGGFAGVGAAACARRTGAEVTLVERTDELLGLGRHSGSYYNDGRQAFVEELLALGGGDIFEILGKPPVLSHPRAEQTWAAFDDLAHRYDTHTFNCMLAETAIRRYLQNIGCMLIFENRAVDVEVGKSSKGIGNKMLAVNLQKGQRLEADAFVDTTGGAGGVQVCIEHGYGCVECSLRCNSFGDRVSIATKAGAPELKKLRDPQHGGGFGAISSACSFYDDSIDPKLLEILKKNGSYKMDVPPEVRDSVKMGLSTNLPFDPSHISTLKMTYPGFFKANGMVYMPLQDVRSIPGLENARFSDPLGGSRGNAVRFMSMAPRENSMRVFGFSNLFVGGEKSGPLVGIQEAVMSGSLAGHNAGRVVFGKEPLTLPPELVLGDFFAFIQERMGSEKGLMEVYGGMKPTYRKRMAQKGWWAKSVQDAIDGAKRRVEAANLTGIMAQKFETVSQAG